MIREAINRISKRYRVDANVASFAASRVGLMLSSEAKPEMLMPFPGDLTSELLEKRVSEQTAKTFLKLARSGKLPPRVIGAAGDLIEEMASIAGIKLEK